MISIEELYKIYQQHPSIQTDTRKIQAGDIFFALKGPNFNGNDFAAQALEKNAAYVIIDEAQPVNSAKIILVNDVLETLQQLAKYHRQQLNIPLIAITGSNGKTTTKELIHAVLSSVYKAYTTKGNLNNHIGIPVTMLQVKKDAEIAVIEMGANHQKEIAGYCEYVLPTHGMITNAGKAHLEGFGGIEGVRKGKGELYDFLRENNGTAFVMWDYEYLREMSKGIKNIITYGTSNANVTGVVLKSESFLQIEMNAGFSIKNISTQLVGDYNLPNVLAAISVGKYFKVPEEKIKSAIENYIPSNSRSQLIENDSNKIILDAYNANPSSMKAAIENFSRLPDANKILILGAMAELGDESMQEHKNIVELIKKYSWKNVALVGGDFLKINHPYLSFENNLQAKEWMQKEKIHNTSFLIKGSRSMQMEKVVE
ncbi:MAG TPA: UDP-N-acetylmuramoyl-tripeptide--D-alanyl-D-alanine ligase [Puia sp.]